MKVSELSPEQRSLLLRRALEKRRTAEPEREIQRRPNPEAPTQLSFAQQRLWFFDQLNPGSATYNVPVAFHLRGPLDPEILRATFSALIQRHESLRTSFPAFDGEPFQVVSPEGQAALPQVDLTGLALSIREDTAFAICRKEAVRPFDLATGPLLRPLLLRLTAHHHLLLCAFHHIIVDMWSLSIFMREMGMAYEALLRGRSPALPELSVQYPDFAVWQRMSLQGDWLERETEHWRQELAGAPAGLWLPTDRPRPPVLGHRGSWLPWHLTADVTGRVRAHAREVDATLFMTLLAAFSLLLARYCSQEDLVLGAPVANRAQVELEGMIGFFVNMLVLRADLTGRPSFRDLLRRVRERCLRAFSHQHLSFDQLVESLGIERDLSRQPLVQATLALQDISLPALEGEGLRLELAQLSSDLANFELMFELSDDGAALWGNLGYSNELFEPATAQRIGSHFAVLLRGIGEFPERSIWELPLLTEAEREQLSWERQPSPESEERGVVELVAAVAARHPTARAAAWQGGELSYGELVERSSRVAAGLRAAGVEPEVVVAIVLERSPDLLVGLLGVLAAGGACLPLAPSRDRAWLELTLERSGVSLLLTTERLLNALPEHGATELLLERLENAGGAGKEPARPRTLPESLAFVIHTSGSRHAPHQVGLEHRSVAAWVRHWRERLTEDELAGVGSAGALETVDGVFDLIVPLCLGGWIALEEREGGALWSATPSELAAQLHEESLRVVPRAIRSFGEPLGTTLSQRLLQRGVRRLHNAYSSAVGGVWEWGDRRRGEPPAGGAEVIPYVLDPAGEPVPAGVPGELWLSGEGLARGYFSSGSRTAESFVPDRLSGRSGSRLAKTGDLARWRMDGALELLGRIERRVEVGGQRLELDAIEKLLSEHPRVLRAVAALQSENGVERLVAYALGTDHRELAADDLRSFLEARLPRPQVPWMIVVISQLPRTPERRVDRQALPRVVEERTDHVAPRTAAEETLAAIWRELLGIERVGVRDRFFQLGGHSLLAVQLMSRIEREFSTQLPVSILYQASTIEALAERIAESSRAPRPSALVSLQPQGAGSPLFFVHPVGGSVLCYRELAERLGSDRPFFGLEASEEDGGDVTLEDMAASYLGAIRDVQAEGPYLLGGWSLGAVIAFEMARQLRLAGETVALLSMVDAPPARPEERQLGPMDEDTWFVGFASDLVGSRYTSSPELRETVLQWDPQRRLAWLFEQARAVGAVPREVTLSQFSRRSDLFRRNLQALSRYRASPAPVDLVFLRSSTPDPVQGSGDPTRGWRQLATGSVACHTVPGDHYSLLREPHVEHLSSVLRSSIEDAVSMPARDFGGFS